MYFYLVLRTRRSYYGGIYEWTSRNIFSMVSNESNKTKVLKIDVNRFFQAAGFKSQTENTPIGFPDSSASSYELVPTRARTVQGIYKASNLALYESAAED